MPPLPFAPRPLAGEGLSSWVARLAVHNFVTPADFWTWLGCDDVHDLTLDDGLLDRLSGSTRLVVNELHRRFAPEPATKAAPLAVSWPCAIRGAACPACCRAAAQDDRDHFVLASSGSLWRFSCPEHRVRLASLDGYGMVLQDGRARFVREGSSIGIGGTGLTAQPAGLALAFEDAISRVLGGQPPGPEWRPRTAASFLACVAVLIDIVLWRRGNGVAFAHEFDQLRISGSETLSLGLYDQRRGAALLTDQGPRNRMNVFAALAVLLARPLACDHPFAVYMDWDRSDRSGLFDYFIGGFDELQRAVIAERLRGWPDCIATPARRALHIS